MKPQLPLHLPHLVTVDVLMINYCSQTYPKTTTKIGVECWCSCIQNEKQWSIIWMGNILCHVVLLPRLLSLQNKPSMCRPSAYRQTVYGPCRPGNGEINTDSMMFQTVWQVKTGSNSSVLIWACKPPEMWWPQCSIYLGKGHTQHHQHTGTGPEWDPPQVVFQEVSVPCLKSTQHRLHLPAAFQAPVQRVHGLLRKMWGKL